MTGLRIALCAPGVAEGGGVPTVAAFIQDSLSQTPRFDVDLISLATSSTDAASIRFRSPRSLANGVKVIPGEWNGRRFDHVGAIGTEFEVARYLPRRALTELLNTYDAVLIVAGFPAWAYLARDVRVPIALQVATRARVEREHLFAIGRGPSTWFRRMITGLTSTIEEAAIRQVDLVFVENSWMYDWVSSRIGKEKVLHAPPGVDIRLFHPSMIDHRREGEPFLLSVGRLSDPRKNVSLLFEAYGVFCDSVQDAPRLVLAGSSGPTEAHWRLAESLGIRNRIEFHHQVTTTDLVSLYRECTMFMLSSAEEGFGMVLIEAMASGAPVISTRCGGPEGIITHGVDGLLVENSNATQLGEAMRTLYESETLRTSLGREARATVEREYSLEVAGSRFVEGLNKHFRLKI